MTEPAFQEGDAVVIAFCSSDRLKGMRGRILGQVPPPAEPGSITNVTWWAVKLDEEFVDDDDDNDGDELHYQFGAASDGENIQDPDGRNQPVIPFIAADNLRHFAVDSRDDLDSALEWMRTSDCIDPKGLAKYLPHTAQGLRDGKIIHEYLAADLSFVFKNEKDNGRNNDNTQEKIQEFTDYVVARAIPENWIGEESREEELLKDLRNGFSCAFASSLFEKWESKWDDVRFTNSGSFAFMQDAKKHFRETSHDWADRIDRAIFDKGEDGSFLASCPLLLEEKDLDSCFCDFFNDTNRSERMKYMLSEAAKAVAQGIHAVHKTCWECGKPDHKTKQCSVCSVAQYCCRDCQVAAWKGGHKKMCKIIKKNKEDYEHSCEIIEDFHEEKDATLDGGLKLRYTEDLRVACLLQTLPEHDFHGEVPGPSMKYYFENLGRVARGEWWFFPPDVSLGSSFREMPDIDSLLTALAYDFHGYISSRDDPVHAVSEVQRLWFDQLAVFSGMTAEAFLQWYQGTPEAKGHKDMSRISRMRQTWWLSSMQELERSNRGYRFEVGTRVLIVLRSGRWEPGEVTNVHYREEDWPEGESYAYRIRLDDGTRVYVDEGQDKDEVVRLEGAEARRLGLRFDIGTKVLCQTGAGWLPGKVISLFYTEPGWPEGRIAPYQIELDGGQLIFSPYDSDYCIKLHT